jgi:hypothetical protein
LRSQVLADCDSDVVQRLFARRPLAVAAWKVIAPNGETSSDSTSVTWYVIAQKMQQPESLLKTF